MSSRRNIYLDLKSVEEARSIFLGHFDWQKARGTEVIPTVESVGRVLAQPVHAVWSAPTYHGAAMDGIAVRAESTYAASDVAPLELRAGDTAYFVNTGEMLPEGTDAVIMIEQVQDLGEGRLVIEAPAFPWQHVRKVGEDIVATELLFTRNHVVRPYCLAALLASGVQSVPVVKRPRLLIVPTGQEIVEPESLAGGAPAPGTIVESNGTVLGNLAEACGAVYDKRSPIGDDLELISRVIEEAVEDAYDLVLVIGGSSAGARDLTRAAIDRVGEVLVHGVTIMPGKPTVLGAAGSMPVVGIPGYPVSAYVAFEEFVAPALARMLGVPAAKRPTASVTPTRKMASRLGMEELVRVRLGRVGDRLVATPLPRGAGTIMSIARADGIIRIPAQSEGIHPGVPVEAELLASPEQIDGHIVAVGSHDVCLDVIADLVRARGAGASLSSSHVGSLAGIMAIKKGMCHLAGAHLLDPSDGSYNRSYVARYLADRPVRMVHLVGREQGLMVAAGNPKGLKGIADLTRGGVGFINRQGGSGTRILLDHELTKLGIDAGAISGYDKEEFTHMAVAVAVASGVADAGLGIRAAARALNLDFIPVASEDYDLIIPEEFFDTPGVQLLLEVIRSPEFAERVAALGGYDTSRTGQQV